MKTKHLLRIAALLLLCLNFNLIFAIAPGGSIMGQILDPETKVPVDGAVVVFQNEGTTREFYTNENGYYYASNIPTGVYTVTVSYMGATNQVKDVKVLNDEQAKLNIPLSSSITMTEVPIIFETNPIINEFNPTAIKIDHDYIKQQVITSVDQIQGTLGGNAVSLNGNYYVGGARADGLTYYLDGCKVMGSPNVPANSIDDFISYTHFIPAKYGDTNGGVIVMDTRNYFSEQH